MYLTDTWTCISISELSPSNKGLYENSIQATNIKWRILMVKKYYQKRSGFYLIYVNWSKKERVQTFATAICGVLKQATASINHQTAQWVAHIFLAQSHHHHLLQYKQSPNKNIKIWFTNWWWTEIMQNAK